MPQRASRIRVILLRIASVTDDVDSLRDEPSRRRSERVEERHWLMASSESAAEVSD